MPGKESKKNIVGVVISWSIGVIFIFGGLGALFSKEFIGAFVLFIMGGVLIPPLNRFISNKIKFELSSTWIKALIIIVGFVIIGVFSDIASEETTQGTATQNVGQLTSEKSSETTKVQTKQQSWRIIKIFEGDTVGGFDVWEDKIAFLGVTEDNGNYYGAIYLYDVSTDNLKRITYDSSGKSFPKIKDNKIYWVDDRTLPSSSIWVYDLDEQKEEKTNLDVVEYLEKEVYGSCYEDKCVNTEKYTVSYKEFVSDGRCPECGSWVGPSYTNLDVFLYDNELNRTIQITNDTYYEQKHPYIWKNKIVWSDNRNGKKNWDIFLYDIDTKEETQITFTQDTSEFHPSIYGDYIVYQKSGDERSIHLYNLKTKEDKKIPEKASLLSENPLKIYDNKVVWRTCKNDWCANEELYLYII